MIRALAIPEILRHVLSNFAPLVLEPHFDFDNGYRSHNFWPGQLGVGSNLKFYFAASDRAALFNAARCSKAFSHVALDILWSVQGSLIPLLRTLPSFILPSGADAYTLVRVIRVPDWKRLQFYAHRIRHLYIPNDENIEDMVFFQVAQLLKDRPLIPVLRTLSYSLSNSIYLFLTPHLRNVEIVNTPSGRISPFFIQTLSRKVPALATFTCREAGLKSRVAWTYVTKIKHLRHMHVANADNLEGRDLKAIFDIEDMSSLSLLIPQKTSLRLSLHKIVADQAYALRTLTLSADPALIADILGCLIETPLSTLRLLYMGNYQEDMFYADEWRARLLTLSCWSKSISHLELQDRSFGSLTPEYSEDPSILEPLLRMGKLKFLLFRPNVTISLLNDDLEKFASAWPELEVLSLDFWGPDEPPLATFDALDAFAEHCPNLQSLFICIQMMESTLPHTPHILNHRLQNLYIDYPASGNNLATVARYLDALFPFLNIIDGTDNGDNIDDDDVEDEQRLQWGDISTAVKHFQAARADHKMRS